MKNRFQGLTVVCALAGMLALGPGLVAAEKDNTKPAAARPGAGAARGERFQAMAKELELTDEQKTKVQEVLKKESEKVRALRDDSSLTPEQRREKMRGIRDQILPEMKKILTAEQFEKWEKLRAERRQRAGGPSGQPQGEKPAKKDK